jgi:hypothetical protein
MNPSQPSLARRIAVSLTVVAALATAFSPASAGADDIGPLTVCGEEMNPEVGGGLAYWRATCNGSTMTVSGWVRDTDADGMCARVKALIGTRWHYSARACPKGHQEPFSFTGSDNDAQVYLYVED